MPGFIRYHIAILPRPSGFFSKEPEPIPQQMVGKHLQNQAIVLTSSWRFHDHGNENDGAVLWLDILDLLLVSQMGLKTVFIAIVLT